MKMTTVAKTLSSLVFSSALSAIFAVPTGTAADDTVAGLRVQEADLVVDNFLFHSGETLPRLKLHYRTFGRPIYERGAIVNAVMLLHGTSASGEQFLAPSFASEMFGAGQPLDTREHFIIIPDGIGHGASSKPSDGLRAQFPHYDYADMVEAQHLISQKLGASRLALLLGTSMGCMHAWLWAGTYPEDSAAIVPVACIPAPVVGRNLLWRRMVIDGLRLDPTYRGGDYVEQPAALATIPPLFTLMTSGQPYLRATLTTPAAADAVVKASVSKASAADANDLIYAFDASRDYDPTPLLSGTQARILTINFADDELNNAQLGTVDQTVRGLARAQAVVLPASPKTRGHMTLNLPVLWKNYVTDVLRR